MIHFPTRLKKIAYFVFSVLLMALPVSLRSSPRDKASADFQTFWKSFRMAVLEGDNDRLVNLTHFPFETRGVLDSDPVLKHDQKWFLTNWPKLIAIDPGLRPTEDSMRQLIERTVEVTRKENPVEGWARVGDFEFKKLRGGWRFVHAYFED